MPNPHETGYEHVQWSKYDSQLDYSREQKPNGKDVTWGKYHYIGPDPEKVVIDFQEVLPQRFDLTTHLIEWKQRNPTEPFIFVDLFSPGGFLRSQIEALSNEQLWDPSVDIAIAATLSDLREEDLLAYDAHNHIELITGDFLTKKKRQELEERLAGRKITCFYFCPFIGYNCLPARNVNFFMEEVTAWDIMYQYQWLQFLYSKVHQDQGVMLMQTNVSFAHKEKLNNLLNEMNASGVDAKIGNYHGGGSWGALSIVRTPNAPLNLPRIPLQAKRENN